MAVNYFWLFSVFRFKILPFLKNTHLFFDKQENFGCESNKSRFKSFLGKSFALL